MLVLQKCLAGVSGGPDSMAMLDMYKKNIKVVCHVNYHKRIDSDIDQKLVEKYCRDNNIILEILNVDKNLYETINNSNFQTQARIIRYDFFKKIADKYNINMVLIAHHQDDFLETAYMQKMRNSASLFYGIKKKNQFKNLKIYRPLIKKNKQDLVDYCKKFKIVFAIDSTNAQDIYERNITRKLIESLSKLEFENFLQEIKTHNNKNYAILLRLNFIYKKWRKNNFDYAFFNQRSAVIKPFLIYKLLMEKDIRNPSKNKINQIIDFIGLINKNKKLRISNDVFLSKKDGNLVLINGNKLT